MLNLTALDRCDRCGAQAYHVATKPGAKSELLFCNHHEREFRNALLERYWLVRSDLSPEQPTPAVAYTE